MRFEDERAEEFFRSTLVQTLFYGVFAAWVLWARAAKQGGSAGHRCSGRWAGKSRHSSSATAPDTVRLPRKIAHRAANAVPSSSRIRPRVGSNGLSWWTCSTGPRLRWSGLTAMSSSSASARARRCSISTSRSSKPLGIPPCASSSASGTPRARWSAIWSRASTGTPCATTSASKGLADERVYVLTPAATGAFLVETVYVRCCGILVETAAGRTGRPAGLRVGRRVGARGRGDARLRLRDHARAPGRRNTSKSDSHWSRYQAQDSGTTNVAGRYLPDQRPDRLGAAHSDQARCPSLITLRDLRRRQRISQRLCQAKEESCSAFFSYRR